MGTLRTGIITLASVCAGVIYPATVDGADHVELALLVPFFALLAAGALHVLTHLGARLLARAIWWSNLLLGTLLTLFGSGQEARLGVLVALLCGVALLVAGPARSPHSDGPDTVPVAHETAWVWALTMSMADTMTLLLWGVLALGERANPLILACVPLMLVGIVGLYRLRVWGLGANIVANLVVAAFIVAGLFGRMPDEAQALLLATAGLQLIVPVPMVLTLIRGRAPRDRQGASRPAFVRLYGGPALVIVCVGIVGVAYWGR